MRTLRSLLLSFLALVLVGVSVAQAAAPQLDSGVTLNVEDIYKDAQVVTDVFSDTGVYGKLTSPADVYKFTADKDGDQTFSLLGLGASASAQPYLILVDPTGATQTRELGIPVPSDQYHTAVMEQVAGEQFYNEPALFEKYNLYAKQRVSLKKDTTYYILVFDPTRELSNYVVRFGDGKVWSGGEVFRYIGTWFKVKSGAFAGTSPFHFKPSTFGALLFLLALGLLVGMWIIEETFSFLANRAKMAGYILIKMQKFSRIFTWIALWFIALGGYIYFNAIGWAGLPFVLTILFIPLVAVFLVRTLVFAPKLMALEVSKQEAVIPVPLRKSLYVMFVLGLLTIGSFVTIYTMLVTP